MKLLLERLQKTDTYTHGKLSIDGNYQCEMIEDKDRGLSSSMSLDEIKSIKVQDETAIPTGIYKIDMNTVSPRFKNKSWAIPYGGKIPRLVDVKGYEGVLIHPGNTVDSTSGCLLPNTSVNNGVGSGSVSAFDKLMEKLLKAKSKGEEITIEIV